MSDDTFWLPTTPDQEAAFAEHFWALVPDLKKALTQSLEHRRAHRAENPIDHDIMMARAQHQLDDLTQVASRPVPYFARLRVTLQQVDDPREEFTVSCRVHQGRYSIDLMTRDENEFLPSYHSAMADLVRNPAQERITISQATDDMSRFTGRQPIVWRVVRAVVEDVARTPDGRWTVAPRYGAVYESRVRERLGQAAQPEADVLSAVLDAEQSRALQQARGTRALYLEGAAGTGKSAVALHRIGILPDSPAGWYLVSHALAKAYFGGAMPHLLEPGQAYVATWRELVEAVWPWKTWFPRPGTRMTDPAMAATLYDVDRWHEVFSTVTEAAMAHVFDSVHRAIEGYTDFLATFSTESALRKPLDSLRRWKSQDGVEDLAQRWNGVINNPQWRMIDAARPFLSPDIRDRALEQAHIDWLSVYRQAVEQVTGISISDQLAIKEASWGDIAAALWLAAIVGRRPTPTAPQWVVVDEAQDIPLLAYAALNAWLVPEGQCLLAGDHMQRRNRVGLRETSDLKAVWPDLDRVVLRRSYRAAPRIIAAAEKLRQAVYPDDPSLNVLKTFHPYAGDVVPIIASDAASLEEAVRDRLARWFASNGSASVVVFVPSLSQADRVMKALVGQSSYQRLDGQAPYTGGLAVTTPATFSGLECDLAIGWDVQSRTYPDTPEAAQALYGLVTRARRAVWLAAVQEPTAAEYEQQYRQNIRHVQAVHERQRLALQNPDGGIPPTPTKTREALAAIDQSERQALDAVDAAHRQALRRTTRQMPSVWIARMLPHTQSKSSSGGPA